MASFELFNSQDIDYVETVLPPDVEKRLAVEAASPFGWHRYTGPKGIVIGMESFGASGPGKAVFEKFGFTLQNIIGQAGKLLGY
jgi:transketolase